MFNFKLFLSTIMSYGFFGVCLSYMWVLALHTTDEYKSTSVTMAVLGSGIIITYVIIIIFNVVINEDKNFFHSTIITSVNLILWDILSIIIVSSMGYTDDDLQRYQLLIIWGNVLTLFLTSMTLIFTCNYYKSISPGEPFSVEINRMVSSTDELAEEDINESSSLILTKNNSTQ